jgi:hypothetical protein
MEKLQSPKTPSQLMSHAEEERIEPDIILSYK